MEEEMENFMEMCLLTSKEELEVKGVVTLVTFIRPKKEAEFLKDVNIPRDKEPMGAIPYEMFKDQDKWYAMIGAFVNRFGAQFSVMVGEAKVSCSIGEEHRDQDCISIQGIKYDSAGLITNEVTMLQPYEQRGENIHFLELVTLTSEDGESQSRLADVTARQDLL